MVLTAAWNRRGKPAAHATCATAKLSTTALCSRRRCSTWKERSDDELSPWAVKSNQDEVEIRLIYPHWRAGTLPRRSAHAPLIPDCV